MSLSGNEKCPLLRDCLSTTIMLNPIRNMMLVHCREVVLFSKGPLSEARLYWTWINAVQFTVAEKDTAAAAKAAVSRPKAAVGRQKAARRLRLAAAAEPRPPICLKINFLAHGWLTRLLSRTHAQGIIYSVCLCHGPHDMHRDLGIITAIKYSKETDLASFGFDRYWLHGLGLRLSTACFLPMRT